MATATGDWGSLPAQLASPTGLGSVTQRLNFVSSNDSPRFQHATQSGACMNMLMHVCY